VSAPYAAVIECVPAVRVVVVRVATPDPFSVPVPSVVPLFLKVIVPVGMPVLGAFAVTVAVNVTDAPEVEGFSDEVSAVEVGASLMVIVATLDVALPAVLVKTARKTSGVFALSGSVSVNEVLVAPLTLVQLPKQVLNKKLAQVCHCTVGVGKPLAAAVNVTFCPEMTVDDEGCVVIAGAWFTRRVKLCVALGVMPLLAVMVMA
jgi:hypothetical protein